MSETPELADWPTGTDPKVTAPGETSSDPKLEELVPLELRLCVQPLSISNRGNDASKTNENDRKENRRLFSAHKFLSRQPSRDNSGNETLVLLTWLSSASQSPMSCECINLENPSRIFVLSGPRLLTGSEDANSVFVIYLLAIRSRAKSVTPVTSRPSTQSRRSAITFRKGARAEAFTCRGGAYHSPCRRH